jgi:adenylylsulfate kinase
LAQEALDYVRTSGKNGKAGSWQLLDGDVIREFLGKEIGYGFSDRRKSVKIMGLLAKCLVENGIGVVVANISPFHDLRLFLREHVPGYAEIYCKCAISVCAARDPKGYYKRQFEEGVQDYVGLDIPFQEPESPDLIIETGVLSLEASVEMLRKFIDTRLG